MYVHGTCANLAIQILGNPMRVNQYNNYICYNTVFHILKEADNNFHPHKDQLAHQEVTAILIGPQAMNQAINVKNTQPVADSVVGIYRRTLVGNHPWDANPSHVAICLDVAGNCISTNNGPVGGAGNLSRFNILDALNWTPNQWPTYVAPAEPGAPFWSQERLVVFRPINTLLR